MSPHRAVTHAAACIIAVLGIAATSHGASARPRDGCYVRVYDASHLKSHKGQFVTKALIDIEPPQPAQLADKTWGIVASVDLRIWVKGAKHPFISFGACSLKDGALACGGSVSAAEADVCRSSKAGVHKCRIDLGDAGDFRIETRPEGVVVAIPNRLELIPHGSDVGPYLNLMSSDPENSDFLLTPKVGACE